MIIHNLYTSTLTPFVYIANTLKLNRLRFTPPYKNTIKHTDGTIKQGQNRPNNV